MYSRQFFVASGLLTSVTANVARVQNTATQLLDLGENLSDTTIMA